MTNCLQKKGDLIWGTNASIHKDFSAADRTIDCCVKFDNGLENFQHAANGMIGLAQLIVSSQQLMQGNEEIGPKNVITAFNGAYASVSFVRVVGTVSQLVTGRFIVSKTKEGTYAFRHFLEITMDLSVAVGRIGSLVNYGNRLDLWSLSEHSQKSLGIVVLTSYSIASAAYIVNELRGFRNNPTIENSAGIATSVADGLEMVSGALFSTFSRPEYTANNPALGAGLGIFAGIMLILSAVFYFIKTWISTKVHPGTNFSPVAAAPA